MQKKKKKQEEMRKEFIQKIKDYFSQNNVNYQTIFMKIQNLLSRTFFTFYVQKSMCKTF